jgi:hypothetical protein
LASWDSFIAVVESAIGSISEVEKGMLKSVLGRALRIFFDILRFFGYQ